MPAGYIYVLVNSSMPGIVKVGKTERTPSQRVDELSGVTGVPTPFIVAYEEYFEDCSAAETYLHTKLTEKGFRVSESREFFRAPASDVIRLVASIPHGILPSKVQYPDDRRTTKDRPWEELLKRATDHRYGEGDTFQDPIEAIKLYRDAARLGSAKALEKLGDMFTAGEGLSRPDEARALEFYKQGSLRGNYFCFLGMARLYMAKQGVENTIKSIAKFLDAGEECNWRDYTEYPGDQFFRMFMFLVILEHMKNLSTFRSSAEQVTTHVLPLMEKYSAEIVLAGNRQLTDGFQNVEMRKSANRVIQQFQYAR